MFTVPEVPAELALLLCSVFGYLFGSIPFGIVLTKPFGYDLRSIGSGNIGATNVLRTGRKDLALATLVMDAGKGGIAAALAGILVDASGSLVAGCAAVLGHNFPIWLRFKGGKGVATTLGVLFLTAWPVGAIACSVWFLMALLTRYSSLSALMALGTAPVSAWFLASPAHTVAFAVLAILAFVRHHENIRRLLQGTESKIRLRKAQ
ncbi:MULTISPECIES: glycerol-3-phosphate 1-O-acyltransferase PlsY [unclassified Haematospirillum]|uniref:glycerol-3-phosphate 1-O-acyltransferase PlsY n=1 Tax=unclassified Haematospirillum TaxID=2622088 RepID=UPI00143C134A|nr:MULTISPECIES: glycerol-3-phosphate 1-O-acyltransferase PlsY [unclassified Haematospirillum]NKD54421.1 glycerol-3-phosphate 1-O-acyltransferase PlsY [Haematospirillum sp. H4890]NKD74464.1 glycerol-3-phosphate 1-O-acyltransferase PlsY [Haematospirillum sp. H4485]